MKRVIVKYKDLSRWDVKSFTSNFIFWGIKLVPFWNILKDAKIEFEKTISDISKILCEGSAIVLDFPNEIETNSEKINKQLAQSAGEEMKSNYSYEDIESIANKNNLLIYEYLNYEDINKEYFYNYNILNPNNKISAPKGVNYCLLVKMNK